MSIKPPGERGAAQPGMPVADAGDETAPGRWTPPRPWGPDSLSWKRGIAWRTALAGRATLLMQAADGGARPLPPHPRFPLRTPVWKIPALPLAALLRLTTAGYLPPVLRERLGLPWDHPRAARFATVVAVTDGLDRLLPERIRHPLSSRTV
ncbi:oxygenase MpaB family protein [Nocardia jiangsuensis]|uniref:Oxygenase MpaB family protein n=1 Tax=Nocardia jiangsuensis TaxID=1691563 RepID=A0ABV8DNI7_9NOCA